MVVKLRRVAVKSEVIVKAEDNMQKMKVEAKVPRQKDMETRQTVLRA